jgi:hypothetical protein
MTWGYLRGSTRSVRTLARTPSASAIGSGSLNGLGLAWRRPNSEALATYRDHLLGTVGDQVKRSRPLSRRTVNLRLTVASEFYKYLAELPHLEHATRFFFLTASRSFAD